jgi:hypothetical protein
MVRCREGGAWAAAALLGLSLLIPAAAPAARDPGDGSTRAPQKPKPHPAPTKVEADRQLLEPDKVSASNLAKELDSKGQVDPVAGLGIRNPVCDQLGQIRQRATRLSCEANGSPESSYPTTNYGFDVFIETGVTHPVGSFTAAFVTILNGIWLGLIFVLKLTLELLGLAFGLNPFSEGQAMGRISASVGRVYDQVTDPWLTTLVVCGGIWLAYRGLLQRNLAGGVGGTMAAVAMIVVGLWVVHHPRDSVGRLAGLSNEVALGTISAPRSGSVNRPVGSYAEAMSDTWARLVEVPFAGLNFSDVGWALSPPPPEAIKRADAFFCDDVGALAMLSTYVRLGSERAVKQCAGFARKRYGRPRRVIDLYLRSSPGSPSRAMLWDYFDGEEDYRAKVAAQGGDGALTRLSMLALFAIGLLGAILLLAWLSIRLFTQAAIAFVLLLAAPFALFFPLLGDGGRRAFKTWGLTLFGALVAKVIYAAFLSIVLLGISILGRLEGAAGSATGFLLSSAFCWSIFLKRAELIGWLRISETRTNSTAGFPLGRTAAYGMGRALSRGLGGSIRGVARRGAEWQRQRRAVGSEATRVTAKDSLQASARALADQRFREARQTVRSFEEHSSRVPRRSTEPTAGPRERAEAGLGEPRVSKRETRASTQEGGDGVPSAEQYERAQELLDRGERNQRRTGERWSTRDLGRYAAEDRELLEGSRDPADHAHRAGYGRAAFESLRGDERERAEAEIEKARRRDLKRLAVVDRPPGRIAGRASIAAERARQGAEGAGPERRERLRALRREHRSGEHLARRRNLSRGA